LKSQQFERREQAVPGYGPGNRLLRPSIWTQNPKMESSTEIDHAAAATGQQANQPKLRGRPFSPGVSGDPTGGRATKALIKQRIAELVEEWSADFEGRLTGIERSLLEQAARLLIRAERTHNPDIAVRASSVAQRMLASVRNKKRKRAGRPPLREQLAEAESVG
jgi:hypothetical protein